MAIWRHLLKPLLPWLGRLLVALVASLAVAWVFGGLFIRWAEPERGDALPPGVAGRMVTAGGRQVHVVENGRGDPVILVHGFAASTLDWEPDIVPALARSHRVVAIDLLGMGFSARADDLAYGYDLWSRQVVDVMDALGIARASLVGHSLGGAIVTIVAGEHPERVEKLVLVAPIVPLEQSERAWFFKALEIPGVGEALLGRKTHLPDLPGFSDAYIARAREIFRRRGTRQALLTYLRHGRDTPRLAAAYRGIRAPTLVVAGTEDDMVPYAAVRRWVPAISDALLLPIGNAGHWLVRDEPRRVVGAIEDFLAASAGQAGSGRSAREAETRRADGSRRVAAMVHVEEHLVLVAPAHDAVCVDDVFVDLAGLDAASGIAKALEDTERRAAGRGLEARAAAPQPIEARPAVLRTAESS